MSVLTIASIKAGPGKSTVAMLLVALDPDSTIASETRLATGTSSRVDVTTQGCIDMKTSLKPRVRLSPDEIATETAPALPPMRLTSDDKAQSFNTRLRASTSAAIEARARAEGATLKQVIYRALFDAGIEVAAVDLEDGTPRRRAA